MKIFLLFCPFLSIFVNFLPNLDFYSIFNLNRNITRKNVNCSGFSGDLENPDLKTESDFDDDSLTSATQRVSNIARQALAWVDENMPQNYHKNVKLVRAVQRVKGKMLVAMSKKCASGALSRHDHERLSQSLESLRISTEPLDQVTPN